MNAWEYTNMNVCNMSECMQYGWMNGNVCNMYDWMWMYVIWMNEYECMQYA